MIREPRQSDVPLMVCQTFGFNVILLLSPMMDSYILWSLEVERLVCCECTAQHGAVDSYLISLTLASVLNRLGKKQLIHLSWTDPTNSARFDTNFIIRLRSSLN